LNNIIEEDALAITNNINCSVLAEKVILITGASGLIGIYFLACIKVISLKIGGIKVVAVIQSEPSEQFKRVIDFKGASYLRGDITDITFANGLPQADYIIHAAGYGQPLKFMESPEKTLKLNTLTTFILFDKLQKDGHFLFISSSEVYSNLKADKYTEDDIGISNTTHPRACYIEGKRAGEAICNAYRTKGIQAFSARLAHTYGPGSKKGDKRVLLAFIEKALNGEINMLDKGEAIRTYCYVADAVEIMFNILLFGKQPIYNVAGKSKTSIYNLAKTIGDIVNVPVYLPESLQAVPGAPKEVQVDTSRAETEFNKSNYISLEDGLLRTISWYKNEINNE
jgi:nucleoside-diphosphate-sugar epimerase